MMIHATSNQRCLWTAGGRSLPNGVLDAPKTRTAGGLRGSNAGTSQRSAKRHEERRRMPHHQESTGKPLARGRAKTADIEGARRATVAARPDEVHARQAIGDIETAC